MSNNNINEMKATIFNIQKYNLYDGPGVRTLIFFQGCHLHCKWCANPEGIMRKYQVMFKSNICSNCGGCIAKCPVGMHGISKETLKHEVNRHINCAGCKKCVDTCLKSALFVCLY